MKHILNQSDEGYIKFHCNWVNAPLKQNDLINELLKYRQVLYDKKLIGVLENGIGFGNLSVRIPGTNKFIITGSATGKYPLLNADHLSMVTSFDISRNQIECTGKIKASSESLTHAAIYLSASNINAVVHTHHKSLWKKFNNIFPTTNNSVAYGTPEMADEIFKIILKPERKESIIIMGGHEDGIISFGENLQSACSELFNLAGN